MLLTKAEQVSNYGACAAGLRLIRPRSWRCYSIIALAAGESRDWAENHRRVRRSSSVRSSYSLFARYCRCGVQRRARSLVHRPEIRGEPSTSKSLFGGSMSLRDRLRTWRRLPPPASLTFHVEKESESFATDDGSIIWASGYTLVDATTGQYRRLRDQHFENPHCLLCRVAGVTYRPDALQDDEFSPGRQVILRPEPTNPHDQYAVGVWDASGSIQLGYVPREHSEHVAVDIASGIPLEGRTLREFRRTPSGPRLGIHILIFPAGPHQIGIDVDHDLDRSNSQPSGTFTR